MIYNELFERQRRHLLLNMNVSERVTVTIDGEDWVVDKGEGYGNIVDKGAIKLTMTSELSSLLFVPKTCHAFRNVSTSNHLEIEVTVAGDTNKYIVSEAQHLVNIKQSELNAMFAGASGCHIVMILEGIDFVLYFTRVDDSTSLLTNEVTDIEWRDS